MLKFYKQLDKLHNFNVIAVPTEDNIEVRGPDFIFIRKFIVKSSEGNKPITPLTRWYSLPVPNVRKYILYKKYLENYTEVTDLQFVCQEYFDEIEDIYDKVNKEY